VVFSDSATKIRSIGIGGNHSLAVSDAGKLYAWGLNDVGQLGFTGSAVSLTPREVTNVLAGKVAVSAAGGRAHSLVTVREVSGWRVFGFGANHRGQLGQANGSPGLAVRSDVPVEVSTGAMGGATVSRVYASGDSSFAVGGLTALEPLSSLAFLPMGMSGALRAANPLEAKVAAGGRIAFDPNVASPTYQWYRNGEPVDGQVSSTYALSDEEAGTPSDLIFRYVVKRGIEEYVSNSFVVSIRNATSSAPVVVQNPASKFVATGTAALSVSAVDTMTGRPDTLTYKWYRSRDGVSWFTTGDFGTTVPAALPGFMYKCLVRGLGGSSEGIFSEPAFVRVIATLTGKHVGTLQNTELDYGTAEKPKFPGRVTLDVTSSGFFTGRLEYEGASYSMSGDLLAAVNTLSVPVIRSTTTPKRLSDVVLDLTFNGLQGGISVSASHSISPTDRVVSSSVLRMSPTSVAANARGVYGAALSPVEASVISRVPGVEKAMPTLQVSTGSTGTVSYTGRTVDGIAVSGSSSLVIDTSGRLVAPVFATMYGVYPYAGQLAGTLTLTPTASVKVSGDLEWRKPDLTLWSTRNPKGTYVQGAIAAYQVLPEATAFSATGFTSTFKPDGVWYDTTFSSSQWDTGTQYRFRTSTSTTSANYSGNVFDLRGITREGLTGLTYSKSAGTVLLNYIRNGRVNYGYGLMFPGGKVYGFLIVDDATGSASWRAQ
jgi:hypothetical protein